MRDDPCLKETPRLEEAVDRLVNNCNQRLINGTLESRHIQVEQHKGIISLVRAVSMSHSTEVRNLEGKSSMQIILFFLFRIQFFKLPE